MAIAWPPLWWKNRNWLEKLWVNRLFHLRALFLFLPTRNSLMDGNDTRRRRHRLARFALGRPPAVRRQSGRHKWL